MRPVSRSVEKLIERVNGHLADIAEYANEYGGDILNLAVPIFGSERMDFHKDATSLAMWLKSLENVLKPAKNADIEKVLKQLLEELDSVQVRHLEIITAETNTAWQEFELVSDMAERSPGFRSVVQQFDQEALIGMEFVLDHREGMDLLSAITRAAEESLRSLDADLIFSPVQILRGIGQLSEIKGLEKLLSRLMRNDEGQVPAGYELSGVANEIIRLGLIAKHSPDSDSLTSLGIGLKRNVPYLKVRVLTSGKIVESTAMGEAEADGFRGNSGTLVEVKYKRTTFAFHEGSTESLRFCNQARKLAAVLRQKSARAIEYHIVAPSIARGVIAFLASTFPKGANVKVIHYTAVDQTEGAVVLDLGRTAVTTTKAATLKEVG
ncbi:MAG: hypothetical protein ABIE84_01695 [bacterium]